MTSPVPTQTVKKLLVVGGPLNNSDSQTVTRVALLGPTGVPISSLTGAGIVLTGYAPVAAAAVSATDTVNAAIAKLEARIIDLETP
jgi:hypothetical protein